MSDYTPSTDEVRRFWGHLWSAHPDAEEAFDRWLESERAAAEQRGAKAERERIARNIEAGPLYFDEHGAPCIDPGVAARISREGA